MTDPNAFFNGFALSAALIVAIGAQNAFVLRQGLRREHVGPIVAFCALADVTLMAAGVAGLGAALDRLPGLSATLTLGGALFLGWYGISALRRAVRSAEGLDTEGRGEALSLGAALARTAGFTLLNPHVYLDTVLLVGVVGAAQPSGGQPAFVAGAGLAMVRASRLWSAAARAILPPAGCLARAGRASRRDNAGARRWLGRA